jgi:sarcosine oxidase subunit beta
MTIDAASTFYFHREGPGMLVGMSYQAEQAGFRDGWTNDWEPDLLEAMDRRAPALLDCGIAHRWTGYYEVTPDHNAVIGEASSVSRFLYATGFSGHGFLQGPAVGEVLRDLYLGQEPVVDVSSLSADRFAVGARVLERGIV